MLKVKVQNMTSPNGNDVPNQFIIDTPEGRYFQSYATIIAFLPNEGRIQLDSNAWRYSRTTVKYRNLFLRRTSAEIERAVTEGRIELTDLN